MLTVMMTGVTRKQSKGGLSPAQKGKSMRYILGIIWDDGGKEIHQFLTREEAEEVERGYKMAFGNQIQYSWVAYK